MKIFFVFTSLVMLLSFTSFDNDHSNNNTRNSNSEESSIYILDTVMVKYLDLSNRNEQEIVKYHLKIKDWSQPVEWSFTVLFGKDTLLIKYSDEVQLDKFFNDTLYIGNCSGYLDCKMQWYLNSILDFNIERINPDDSRIPLFKKESKSFIEKYGENEEEAEQNYKYFWEYYSEKEMRAVHFRFAPEGRSTPLLVIHPKLNKLVPIYSP